MKSTIWVLAIVMALGMGPTVVLLDLRPSNRGERRAEISGRAKSDSLLTDQEAVCLQVVAGARNCRHQTPVLELEVDLI